ncbi:MAG: DUF3883 domain-containing protein [Streptosporangiaceae bacterium]
MQFEAMLRAAERNGLLGEFVALEHERKRLTKAGRRDLAEMVQWTSQENVAAGFDIASFDIDGAQRYVEVKATAGEGRRFVATRNEWHTAQAYGEQYWFYLVVNVNDNPEIVPLQNPIDLERTGLLIRDPDGWVVRMK